MDLAEPLMSPARAARGAGVPIRPVHDLTVGRARLASVLWFSERSLPPRDPAAARFVAFPPIAPVPNAAIDGCEGRRGGWGGGWRGGRRGGRARERVASLRLRHVRRALQPAANGENIHAAGPGLLAAAALRVAVRPIGPFGNHAVHRTALRAAVAGLLRRGTLLSAVQWWRHFAHPSVASPTAGLRAETPIRPVVHLAIHRAWVGIAGLVLVLSRVGGALLSAVKRLGEVTNPFLLATSADFVALRPLRPLPDIAIDRRMCWSWRRRRGWSWRRTRVLVAFVHFVRAWARLAFVLRRLMDLAEPLMSPARAARGAGVPIRPVHDLTVDRARLRVANLMVYSAGLRRARLASVLRFSERS